MTASPYTIDLSARQPWHQIGADISKAKTVEEAMTLSETNFTATTQPLWAEDGSELVNVPSHRAVIRDDTGTILGVVGRGYDVLQPVECFSFLDRLVGDHSLQFERGGCLRDGRLVWMLASVHGAVFDVVPDDTVASRVLGVSRLDGSGSTVFAHVLDRFACSNAINAALSRARTKIKIRHTRNQRDRMNDAEKVLAFGRRQSEAFAVLCKSLARRQVTTDEVSAYVRTVAPADNEEDVSTQTQRIRATVTQLFEQGVGAELAPGSAWQLLNATTEYTNHVRSVRGSNQHEARAYGTIFQGAGASMNDRALTFVTNLVQA